MAAPRRRLVFLLGAHKTASSHLQASLLGAQAALRARGTAAIDPKTMRADLTPLTHLPRQGVSDVIGIAAADAFLRLHAGDARRVLLMDENILGSTDRKMLMRKKKLYPWAHLRLPRFLALFPGHDIALGLAIRNPSTFLPSCWSESLHHGALQPFDAFVKGIEPERLRWSNLLERLHEAAPSARFVVWRYEDYSALGPRLPAALAGTETGEIHPVERIMRPGLSAEAAQWLFRQPDPDRDALLTARKKFPKTEGAAAFDPWTAERASALDAAYAEDLRHIDSLPWIRRLAPDA